MLNHATKIASGLLGSHDIVGERVILKRVPEIEV